MRNFTSLALLVFVVAGSLTACNRESTAADNKPLGTKVQDSIEAGKEKLAAAQQEFRAKTDTKLNELEANIARLKMQASEATGETQVKLQELADTLETKREVIAAKLEDLKSISADKWQSFSADVSRMVDDLQRATSDALDKAK